MKYVFIGEVIDKYRKKKKKKIKCLYAVYKGTQSEASCTENL